MSAPFVAQSGPDGLGPRSTLRLRWTGTQAPFVTCRNAPSPDAFRSGEHRAGLAAGTSRPHTAPQRSGSGYSSPEAADAGTAPRPGQRTIHRCPGPRGYPTASVSGGNARSLPIPPAERTGWARPPVHPAMKWTGAIPPVHSSGTRHLLHRCMRPVPDDLEASKAADTVSATQNAIPAWLRTATPGLLLVAPQPVGRASIAFTRTPARAMAARKNGPTRPVTTTLPVVQLLRGNPQAVGQRISLVLDIHEVRHADTRHDSLLRVGSHHIRSPIAPG